MAMNETRRVLLDPLVDSNPVTLQVLGVCSALAVTTSLLPTLLMCVALTSVAALSGAAISSIREHRRIMSDQDNPKSRVAVFCHGGVINAWATHVLGMKPQLFADVTYTSISRFFAASSGERSLASLNEAAHLR
jgi:Na+-translocating ferredoxin:NAD+ oxidoreductase RnfE subunit